jgi:hypothetical protein
MRMRALLAVLLLGCRPSSNPAEAGAPVVEAAAQIVEAAAPQPDVDPAARAIVMRWNEAHQKRDANALEGLYAGYVFFYGKRLTSKECAAKYKSLFTTTPDYTQTLSNFRTTRAEGATSVLVEFTKTTTANGKTTGYPSYIVLDASLRIIEESDATTDANLKTLAQKAREASDAPPKTCEQALDKIAVLMDNKYPLKNEKLIEGGEGCRTVHVIVVDDPNTGAGRAPRMYSYCVDLRTGETTATGGWLMADAVDHDMPIDIPKTMKSDVARLCKGKAP